MKKNTFKKTFLLFSIMNNVINFSTDMVTKIVFNAIGSIFSFVALFVNFISSITSPLSFGITIASAIYTLIFSLLNGIRTGNGYTIVENWHDHGLNDWYFQMNNNQKNMFQIALSFSDSYRNSIEWKIIDGWFTLPKIYIRRGQIARNKNYGWHHLSFGSSFNFGNRLPIKLYS